MYHSFLQFESTANNLFTTRWLTKIFNSMAQYSVLYKQSSAIVSTVTWCASQEQWEVVFNFPHSPQGKHRFKQFPTLRTSWTCPRGCLIASLHGRHKRGGVGNEKTREKLRTRRGKEERNACPQSPATDFQVIQLGCHYSHQSVTGARFLPWLNLCRQGLKLVKNCG